MRRQIEGWHCLRVERLTLNSAIIFAMFHTVKKPPSLIKRLTAEPGLKPSDKEKAAKMDME